MVLTRVSYCERIQAMHLTGTYNRSREKCVQFFPGDNRRSEQLKTYTPNIIKTKGQTPPLKKKIRKRSRGARRVPSVDQLQNHIPIDGIRAAA